MPCIESYQKVDLRTITLGVPPQEVSRAGLVSLTLFIIPVMNIEAARQIYHEFHVNTKIIDNNRKSNFRAGNPDKFF